jgi:hypothetical protein
MERWTRPSSSLPLRTILKLKSFSPKQQQPEPRRKERKKIVEAPSAEAFFNERMLKHKKIIRSFLKRKRNQRQQKRESESKKRVGILIKRKKRKERKKSKEVQVGSMISSLFVHPFAASLSFVRSLPRATFY